MVFLFPVILFYVLCMRFLLVCAYVNAVFQKLSDSLKIEFFVRCLTGIWDLNLGPLERNYVPFTAKVSSL